MKRATVYVYYLIAVLFYFNPRPREEGDSGQDTQISRLFVNFNPRPREEGDQGAVIATRNSPISIHALVKRATVTHAQLTLGVVISIHALVKRATIRLMSAERNSFYFNPRPREEGDGTT